MTAISGSLLPCFKQSMCIDLPPVRQEITHALTAHCGLKSQGYLCELCLANARGPAEHEGSNGTVGVLQPHTCSLEGCGHCCDGLFLPNYPLLHTHTSLLEKLEIRKWTKRWDGRVEWLTEANLTVHVSIYIDLKP